MEQVIRLCGRTVLLDEGNLLLSGQPDVVVAQFQHLLKSGTAADVAMDEHAPNSSNAIAYEPNGALIESVQLTDARRQPVGQLCNRQPYQCSYRVRFTQDATNVRYAILLRTIEDQELGGAMSAPSPGKGIASVPRGSVTHVEFTFDCTLNPGAYLVSVAVFGSEAGVEYALHGVKGALTFLVAPNSDCSAIGAVDFGFQATTHPRNMATN